MTGAGARFAALEALLHVDKGNGYSNIILNSTLQKYPLNENDKALASVIFYGVLERRITIDYIIGVFSKKPLKKLSAVVLETLRIGIYQIVYLDKVPDSAAVNESVKLVKKNGNAKAAGFVNAVLRNFLRSRDKVHFPDINADPIRYLSLKYSFPEWIVKLWIDSYGEKTAVSLLESMDEKPDIYVRVNNTVVSEEKLLERFLNESLTAEPVKWLDNSVKVNGGNIINTSAYRDGLFHVQDLSSQICCFLLSPKCGETVADVCSAPGGKTFTSAEKMGNCGKVLSFDKYPSRVKLVKEGAERLNLKIVETYVRDAAAAEDTKAVADKVLCDVPCSGLGVIRRKPEIRYKQKSELDSLPYLQYRILCRSSALVKAGGILFYSTCTLNPKENYSVAERFLSENSSFEAYSLKLPPAVKRMLNEPENQLTLMPFSHGTDGFFISAFIKTRE